MDHAIRKCIRSYGQGDINNNNLGGRTQSIHSSIHQSIRSPGDQTWMLKSFSVEAAFALMMMTPTLHQTWGEAPPAHTKPSGVTDFHDPLQFQQPPDSPQKAKREPLPTPPPKLAEV